MSRIATADLKAVWERADRIRETGKWLQEVMFGLGRMPARHLRWMRTANGAAFAGKEYFYAVKRDLLAKRGLPDGFDEQLIIDRCHACEGTGIWHRWADHAASCYRCDETGIWQFALVKLSRWLMNDLVFHIPETFQQLNRADLIEDYEAAQPRLGAFENRLHYRLAMQALGRGARGFLYDRVKPRVNDPMEGWRCAMKFMRVYDRAAARRMWRNGYIWQAGVTQEEFIYGRGARGKAEG